MDKLIDHWFTERFGAPTDIQSKAWKHIASGSHVLLSAPTGMGKTLAAALPAIDALLTGRWPPGVTSVVYVSPLKALNNDIRLNISDPLRELLAAAERDGRSVTPINIQTRSGDSTQSERRRMLRRPPEILVTTPESLNLLLSSRHGVSALGHVRMVILDEIHSVVATKRGAHLITAVERIVGLSGEVQRVALSATIASPQAVADFVGGYQQSLGTYKARAVQIVTSKTPKERLITVEHIRPSSNQTPIWRRIAEDLLPILRANSSTAIFVNSRRLCESITKHINDVAGEMIAYAHHGSLSKDVRSTVESRLKAGSLRAVVATGTLELGIDIGSLDEVVLVQSPNSVSSALQRIGRAGHSVGAISKARLIPTHGRDLLEMCALRNAVEDQALEPCLPIECPLDVLAQVIVSMLATEAWAADRMYDHIRQSFTYRHLSHDMFMDVVNMLLGKYSQTRIRDLQPRIAVDRDTQALTLRKGSLQALYGNSGTIPDRGYFHLRRSDSKERIGELDEEFVWENGPGSRFTFANQNWQVEQVTHSEVLVSPYGGAASLPFWKAEEPSRSFHLSERLLSFLHECEQNWDTLDAFLLEKGVSGLCLEQLSGYLRRQRSATTVLPNRHHVVIEHIETTLYGAPQRQTFLHFPYGRALTRPLSLAIQSNLNTGGTPYEVYAGNNGIAILTDEHLDLASVLNEIDIENPIDAIRETLEGTQYFGAAFRESAACALVLGRGKIGQRMPLWLSRLRAQELLSATAKYDRFPITAEAWRSVCADSFDFAGLTSIMSELQQGGIKISTAETSTPSPFAEDEAWRQLNEYMYADEASAPTTTHTYTELIRSLVLDETMRPAVDEEDALELVVRLQRLLPDYAPNSDVELVEYVSERLIIPESEWNHIQPLLPFPPSNYTTKHLARITLPSGRCLIVAGDDIPTVLSLYVGNPIELTTMNGETLDAAHYTPCGDAVETFHTWLRFYGPVSLTFATYALCIDPQEYINSLVESRDAVCGPLLAGSDELHVCDMRNLESLYRRARNRRLVKDQRIDLAHLPARIAEAQSIGIATDLHEAIEPIIGAMLPVELIESDILPARILQYDPVDFDQIFLNDGLRWIGAGRKKIVLTYSADDMDMHSSEPSQLIDIEDARFAFPALRKRLGRPAAEAMDALWIEAWAGTIANDGFGPIRAGLHSKFKLPEISHRAGRRNRDAGAGMLGGNWYSLPSYTATDQLDAIDIEEQRRERVWILIARYGILFREILRHERRPFRWSELIRTLRRMELAGELLAGWFVDGIKGLQFTTANWMNNRESKGAKSFWLNAADPASPCGLLPIPELPERRVTNHIAFVNTELALVSEANAKRLHIFQDDTHIDTSLFDVLEHLLKRRIRPRRGLKIETINTLNAAESPYVAQLRQRFLVHIEGEHLTVHREY